MGAYKEPHGGTLKELYLSESDAAAEKRLARDLPSWDLTARQICDLELLLNGAFSPLDGFLIKRDYTSGAINKECGHFGGDQNLVEHLIASVIVIGKP